MDSEVDHVDDFEDETFSPVKNLTDKINSNPTYDFDSLPKLTETVKDSTAVKVSDQIDDFEDNDIASDEKNVQQPISPSNVDLDTGADDSGSDESINPKQNRKVTKNLSDSEDGSSDPEEEDKLILDIQEEEEKGKNDYLIEEESEDNQSIDSAVEVDEEDLVVDYSKVGRWTNSEGCAKVPTEPSSTVTKKEKSKKEDIIEDIHLETQRMVRENYIELPKHEPKQCINLKEFRAMLQESENSQNVTLDDFDKNEEKSSFPFRNPLLNSIPKDILNKPVSMSCDLDGFITLDEDNSETQLFKKRFEKQINCKPQDSSSSLSLGPKTKGSKTWKSLKENLMDKLKTQRLLHYDEKIKSEREQRGDENWNVDDTEVEKIVKGESSTDEDFNCENESDGSDVTISDDSNDEEGEEEKEVDEENMASEKSDSGLDHEEAEDEEELIKCVKKKRKNPFFDAEADDEEEFQNNSADDEKEEFDEEQQEMARQKATSFKKESINSEMDLFSTQCSDETLEKSKSIQFYESPLEEFMSGKNLPVTDNNDNSRATTILINATHDSMPVTVGLNSVSSMSTLAVENESKTILISGEKTLPFDDTIKLSQSNDLTQPIPDTQPIDEKLSEENAPTQILLENTDAQYASTQLIENQSVEEVTEKQNPNFDKTQPISEPVEDEPRPDDELENVGLNESQIIHDQRRDIFGNGVFDNEGLSEIEEDDNEEETGEEKKEIRKSRVVMMDELSEKEDAASEESEDEDEASEDNDFADEAEESEGEEEELDEEQRMAMNIKKKKSKKSEFYDEEAELSGSEDEQKEFADDDEVEDIDKQIAELKEMAEQFIDYEDDKKYDKRKIRQQLDKLYQRMEFDRDIREIKRIKEMLFEEGDLYNGENVKRTRKFRWLGLDDKEDFFLKFSDEESDESEDETNDCQDQKRPNNELMSQWLGKDLKASSKPKKSNEESLFDDDNAESKDKENQGKNTDPTEVITSFVSRLGSKAFSSLISKANAPQSNPLRTIDINQKKRQSFLKNLDKQEKEKNLAEKPVDEKTMTLVKNYNLQQKTSLSCFTILDSEPKDSAKSVFTKPVQKKQPISLKRPSNSPANGDPKRLKTSSIFSAMKIK